jgi:repressor LexA
MPHALTERQKEYLEFIREYVKENESSPRLEEIADHFGVKSPTAHKTLKALMRAGYLYFGRDSFSGFFIRLIERAGSAEQMIEINTVGKVNRFGEVYDFPEKYGHFATVLVGADPQEVFALAVIEDIPKVSMLAGDLLICDYGKKPQPGDIAIIPFGLNARRWFLARMYSLTYDKDTPQLMMANQYPRPEALVDQDLGQKLNWMPLAYDEGTEADLQKIAEAEDVPMGAIPPDHVLATVLRLTRNLAF